MYLSCRARARGPRKAPFIESTRVLRPCAHRVLSRTVCLPRRGARLPRDIARFLLECCAPNIVNMSLSLPSLLHPRLALFCVTAPRAQPLRSQSAGASSLLLFFFFFRGARSWLADFPPRFSSRGCDNNNYCHRRRRRATSSDTKHKGDGAGALCSADGEK